MSHPEFEIKIVMIGDRPSPSELKMIRRYDEKLEGVPANDIKKIFADKGFHIIGGLLKPYVSEITNELDKNSIEYIVR